MLIFPAIDLKDGRVVRLCKGSFDTVHQVADSPLETARAFSAAGTRHLHMVDLDGAKDGKRKNAAIVQSVAEVGLNIELGGGIRSMADVEKYGPERVAVGVDARDGLVRTAGWVENAGVDYLAFARRMEALGVQYLIFTDIDTDGMLSGPAFGRLKALQNAVSCSITASGGVSSNEDLRRLQDMGLYAAIVGKAWYAGAVDLAQAVREGGPQ